jgi:hypothetical protein
MGKRWLQLVLAGCVALLSVGAGARTVAAQPPPADGLDVNTFDVAVGKHVYVTQHGAHIPDHLEFGLGLMLSYARNPLAVFDVDGDDNRGDRLTGVVENLLRLELYSYLGLFEALSLGLSMPLGPYTSGQEVDFEGNPVADGEFGAFTWGDLALHVKARFFGKERGFALGAHLAITAPVGRYAEMYVGEKSVTFRPRLLLEYRHPVTSVAANLGGIFRAKEIAFFGGAIRVGQQLTYGLAASVTPARKIPLRLMLELYGRTDFTSGADRNPLEVGGAVAYGLPKGVHLLLGAAAGLVSGIGTPDFRVYLGLRWAPDWKDSDGDGIIDTQDKCPKQKEDRDGFQDEDGCPDPDNDGDGIPDEQDKCPLKPEDNDRFQDEDGCPDLDNDGDGIPDKQDNCPMAKGPAATKGCPATMLDTDGDEVPDSRDKCPTAMEDRDGFQDEDGCPDPDNDGDGILDEQDKCPNAAEDKDGFQDGDGCPDPDDDGDGVCDDNPTIQRQLAKLRGLCLGADKCPKKKETINGRADGDGCPDRGRGTIVLSTRKGKGYVGKLIVRGGIRFQGYSTRLVAGSKGRLKQLAHYLRANPRIKKLTVMAFTDLRQRMATRTTRAWAAEVQDSLIKQGIAVGRVVAVGAGASLPLCRTKLLRCNKKNRRIELYVTELGP